MTETAPCDRAHVYEFLLAFYIATVHRFLDSDARDKYPSGVVGGRTVIECVAAAASADGESGVKVKRIARKTRAICCEPLSREMTLKSH